MVLIFLGSVIRYWDPIIVSLAVATVGGISVVIGLFFSKLMCYCCIISSCCFVSFLLFTGLLLLLLIVIFLSAGLLL